MYFYRDFAFSERKKKAEEEEKKKKTRQQELIHKYAFTTELEGR
jgi:hypothetical protein